MPYNISSTSQQPAFDGPPRNCENSESYQFVHRERFGKITGIVYVHPTYGAHALVTPYERFGPPLYNQPTGEPEERAWSTPNRTMFNYSINEWVALVPCPPGVNVGQFAVKYA